MEKGVGGHENGCICCRKKTRVALFDFLLFFLLFFFFKSSICVSKDIDADEFVGIPATKSEERGFHVITNAFVPT